MKEQKEKEKVVKLSNLENLPKEIEKFLKEHSEYNIKKYLITIETSKEPGKTITIISLSPTLDVLSSIIKDDFSAVIEQIKKDPLFRPKPMPELSGHFRVEGNIPKKEIFQAINEIEHVTVQAAQLEKLIEISKEELTMDMLLDYLLVTE
jgi:hypothetical protein